MTLNDILQATLSGQASWLVECGALFFVPFLHEDLAIVGAALLITGHRLPSGLALPSLYAGMIASDLLLYGLGAAARHNDSARRILIGPRVQHLGDWLRGHMASVILASRLVPGLIFPSYVACGWFGLSLRRFTIRTMATAAFYLPIMLALAMAFGEVGLERLGNWSWVGFIIPVVAASILRRRLMRQRSTPGPTKRNVVFALADSSHHQPVLQLLSQRGMPPVGARLRAVSVAERVPPLIFYIPLVIQWLWLGLRYRSWTLPTAANPLIENGGMWGESKSACLRLVAPDSRHWIADFVTIRRAKRGTASEADAAHACAAMAEAGLTFPIVAKPDIGWRGFGVRLITDEAALREYVSSFPPGNTIILQRLAPHDGEAGILYARMPSATSGRIVSLTLRYFPHVIGDGLMTVRELVLRDQRGHWKAAAHFGGDPKHLGLSVRDLDRVPSLGETMRLSFIGSNRVGGLYRDGHRHITDALTTQVDAISRMIPEFHFGRYDIRFKSLEALERGEEFLIIEINGIGGESIDVWDPEVSLPEAYRRLFRQQNLLFAIGDRNRNRGFASIGATGFFRYLRRQNQLIARCPPSN